MCGVGSRCPALDAPCRLEGHPGPGFLSIGLLPRGADVRQHQMVGAEALSLQPPSSAAVSGVSSGWLAGRIWGVRAAGRQAPARCDRCGVAVTERV